MRWLSLALFVLAGCSPAVVVPPAELGPVEVSGASRDWIAVRGFDPAERDVVLEAFADGTPGTRAADLAEAEVALAAGEHARAALAAWRVLTARPPEAFDPVATRAAEVQADALAHLIRDAADDEGRLPRVFESAGVRLRLVGDRIDEPTARFTPTRLLDTRDFLQRHTTPGVGCPVAVRIPDPGPPGENEDYFPPPGVVWHTTALLLPTGEDVAELRLIDRDANDEHAGLPLAADHTGVLAMYHTAGPNLNAQSVLWLLDGDAAGERLGLYLLRPFDPDKIPLLMVHGLKSNPAEWHEIANAVWGDPVLRERYQLIYFYYPTSDPFGMTSWRMRRWLERYRERFDPDETNVNLDRTVVFAHSLGGLVTRMLLVDGGDDFFTAVMHERPLGELDLPDDVRRRLREIFYAEPLGEVARVVFFAVPHRGAGMASTWYARLGGLFVRPTEQMVASARALVATEPGLNEFVKNRGGLISGISDLEPDSPLIRALGERPPEGVPFHTVVGSAAGPWPDGGDGIVPHASSRLAGARSTLVVPGGHGVPREPAAVREAVRVLHLHLAEVGD